MIDVGALATSELLSLQQRVGWEVLRRLWWAYALMILLGIILVVGPSVLRVLRRGRRKNAEVARGPARGAAIERAPEDFFEGRPRP